jgi:hypothetical protein
MWRLMQTINLRFRRGDSNDALDLPNLSSDLTISLANCRFLHVSPWWFEGGNSFL